MVFRQSLPSSAQNFLDSLARRAAARRHGERSGVPPLAGHRAAGCGTATILGKNVELNAELAEWGTTCGGNFHSSRCEYGASVYAPIDESGDVTKHERDQTGGLAVPVPCNSGSVGGPSPGVSDTSARAADLKQAAYYRGLLADQRVVLAAELTKAHKMLARSLDTAICSRSSKRSARFEQRKLRTAISTASSPRSTDASVRGGRQTPLGADLRRRRRGFLSAA
jgi:hypothetical protein